MLATMIENTTTRAPNVSTLRAAVAAIPNFGKMSAKEQTEALKAARKEHGRKSSTEFYLVGETGLKVRIPKTAAFLISDLKEALPPQD